MQVRWSSSSSRWRPQRPSFCFSKDRDISPRCRFSKCRKNEHALSNHKPKFLVRKNSLLWFRKFWKNDLSQFWNRYFHFEYISQHALANYRDLQSARRLSGQPAHLPKSDQNFLNKNDKIFQMWIRPRLSSNYPSESLRRINRNADAQLTVTSLSLFFFRK